MVSSAVGCTSLLGEFEVGGTTEAGPNAASDASVAPLDGAVESSAADGGSEVDAALPEPAIPCDSTEKPDVARGVFVSVDGDDSAGAGTPLLPFKTINRGVTAVVAAGKKHIYVAQGTYAESLTFDAAKQGFFISGGWARVGDLWSRDCAPAFRTRTVLASPSNVAVRVTNVTSTTGLDSLTVATKATCGASETCVGVAVSGPSTVFALRKVRVVAGAGGTGVSASVPAPAGNRACLGTTDCGNGSTGGIGSSGKAAVAGKFVATGFVVGDGEGGGTGGVGQNGVVGAAGVPTTCATAGIGQCQSGGDQCVHGASPSGLSPSGLCGCGGLGGVGGAGGRGGGASVALFVGGLGAIVAMEATSLVAGDGGAGASGATGGDGGGGTPGTVGASKTCPQDNGPNGPVNVGTCGCVGLNSKTFSGGLKGGAGGKGGPGGPGGGGAGGASYAVVRVGGALTTGNDPFMQLAPGKAGAGAAGAPNGATGDVLVIP